MSALGHLLLDLGVRVLGSDLVLNDEIRQLQGRGAQIFRGHAGSQIDSTVRLVVYSSAVRDDNAELQAAAKLGIPSVRRAVLLATLAHRQRALCVAGMHGKTTTTALLAFALDQLGLGPSYAVGALVPQLRPHARFSPNARPAASGSPPWFVMETDESDGTLGQFHPEQAVILNVDAEHLDHFANIDAVVAEFREFVEQTAKRIVFCADDPRLAELCAHNPRAVSYGFHPLAAYRAELNPAPASRESRVPTGASRSSSPTGSAFQVWHKGALLGSFRIELLGQQNVSNATAVIAVLHQEGFSPDEIARAIASFTGAARRQQELFRDERVRVVEDYGHHPNEIRATLRALQSLDPGRLMVVFQPHRFTRTQHLWREFATCFAGADQLWLAELYPASEPEIPGINSGFLGNAIRAQGQAVEGVLPLNLLGDAILNAIRPGDLVVFLGAGDITRVAHEVADALREGRTSVRKSVSPDADFNPAKESQPGTVSKKVDYAELSDRLGPEVALRRDEPLAKKTTLRVGGKADLYVEPASENDLAQVLRFCAERSVEFMILGRGSNLLIRDGGIRGVVISLAHPHFSQVSVAGEKLRCGAGARLKQVAIEARRHGLSGLEFLEGIPGSVGGAMRMNAGAMGSWLFDVVETIRFVDRAGSVHERRASEINVEYRGCPLFKTHIALGAVLVGQAASKEAIQSRMDSFSRKRWETQPSQPSAGCIFKNPKTIPAGKLIDELGLKGTRVGGAAVSDVHANFIINTGTATARDVLGLIEVIKERARSMRGIELETEVEILGEG
jgi:UDP-N-acetylmuramate--L-alanine ligase/UDP-N-acetylenolpyruvoylglucosamine reductase